MVQMQTKAIKKDLSLISISIIAVGATSVVLFYLSRSLFQSAGVSVSMQLNWLEQQP